MNTSRRSFLKGLGLGGVALSTPKLVFAAAETIVKKEAMLPEPKGNRVVIVGGGWAGLTVAKYLKKEAPNAEVILIEKRPNFFSCPISNEWLADLVSLDFLSHDYNQPAAKYGYKFINTTVLAIERDKRRVYTPHGYIQYDYLVLAPGIKYNYSAWFKDNKDLIKYTMLHYPSAFIPGSEHLALKRKIWNFEEGEFVITVPPGAYRCPPAPYERAAMIAYVFKKNKVKGRVVILDPKPEIVPKGPGFMAAYNELYAGIVEYVPNAHIKEVDPIKKVIKTSQGDFNFTDANLNPPHQAGELVWMADLIAKDKDGKPTGWADQDHLTFQAKSDPRVFLVGDVIGGVPYPKSGHMANSQGKIVAKIIAARMMGKDITPALPDNTCYSMVNGDPQEAIVISVEYSFNEKEKKIVPKPKVINQRSQQLAKATYEWAKGLYRDMFA
ncbi:FAD-dependent oxidoreductase [Thermocrinis minervae]|uniref:Tat (Twin-arginine translocation) pathway signal sequence n=1 Tax=Thermocrinis minervae TaxID=381751 RepID=A0A1M6R9X3_9AQUI|nr:FAD-dependent oxidoreductase [Thermocrinis minervae]SHK29128.1 Tat (twin-arginine translocation) pathway signal sequence [Thermocrinis minervae]